VTPDLHYVGLGLPFGPELNAVMADLRKTASAGAMVHDEDTVGVVNAKSISLEFGDGDRRRMLAGLRRCAEVYFAAGARYVVSSVAGAGVMRDMAQVKAQLHEDVPFARITAISSHPMGTCRTGDDPGRERRRPVRPRLGHGQPARRRRFSLPVVVGREPADHGDGLRADDRRRGRGPGVGASPCLRRAPRRVLLRAPSPALGAPCERPPAARPPVGARRASPRVVHAPGRALPAGVPPDPLRHRLLDLLPQPRARRRGHVAAPSALPLRRQHRVQRHPRAPRRHGPGLTV
jgi:hypothetical protein